MNTSKVRGTRGNPKVVSTHPRSWEHVGTLRWCQHMEGPGEGTLGNPKVVSTHRRSWERESSVIYK